MRVLGSNPGPDVHLIMLPGIYKKGLQRSKQRFKPELNRSKVTIAKTFFIETIIEKRDNHFSNLWHTSFIG